MRREAIGKGTSNAQPQSAVILSRLLRVAHDAAMESAGPEYQPHAEITKRFGISRSRIFKLLADGHIEARRPDAKTTLIRVASVRRWLEAQPRDSLHTPKATRRGRPPKS